MREILFKAKRASNRKWVQGGIIYTFHPEYPHENQAAFIEQRPNCYAICADEKDYFVDQNSICQCTGLIDRNGRKIFEGDIVTIEGEDEYFTVEWDNDTARYVMSSKTYVSDFENYWGYEVEIIGNIFDNPELVK